MDITADEELQAKEFLKRAEIMTMKKDLQQLREFDALEERNKIVKGKTLEEEKTELENKKIEEERKSKNEQRERVLSKNVEEERSAEKQIKNYAEESEKQQIFLFEAQRVGLEKEIGVFEKEKEPSLNLEKNQILIEKRNQETKLNNIISEEQKTEEEQKFISEKEKTSNVPSEKRSLEEKRGELEIERQEIEKKRWIVEKELKRIEETIIRIDIDYEKIVEEKNNLKEEIRIINSALREIYSRIIKRVEDKKKGLLEQQQTEAARIEQLSSERKEDVQRKQWARSTGSGQARSTDTEQTPKEKEFLKEASDKVKERIAGSLEAEEEQRKKFLEDIEKQAIEEQNKNN